MKNKIILLCMFLYSALLVWFDYFTKVLAIDNLKGKPDKILIKGVLELQYVENKGAAFGSFEGKRIGLLIITSVIMLIVIFYMIKATKYTGTKYRIIQILLATILAGAIGNMIDRVRSGVVTDFIRFAFVPEFPVCNVADVYVVLAVYFMLLFMLVYIKDEEIDSFLSLKKAESEEKSDSCI